MSTQKETLPILWGERARPPVALVLQVSKPCPLGSSLLDDLHPLCLLHPPFYFWWEEFNYKDNASRLGDFLVNRVPTTQTRRPELAPYYTYTHTHIHLHTLAHTHAHAHACTHTHTHTFTHTTQHYYSLWRWVSWHLPALFSKVYLHKTFNRYINWKTPN